MNAGIIRVCEIYRDRNDINSPLMVFKFAVTAAEIFHLINSVYNI